MRMRSRATGLRPARAAIQAAAAGGIGGAFHQDGVETEEAQDAQIIFRDARAGSPMKRTRRAARSASPPT